MCFIILHHRLLYGHLVRASYSSVVRFVSCSCPEYRSGAREAVFAVVGVLSLLWALVGILLGGVEAGMSEKDSKSIRRSISFASANEHIAGVMGVIGGESIMLYDSDLGLDSARTY